MHVPHFQARREVHCSVKPRLDGFLQAADESGDRPLKGDNRRIMALFGGGDDVSRETSSCAFSDPSRYASDRFAHLPALLLGAESYHQLHPP
jgi:hypothetical protein